MSAGYQTTDFGARLVDEAKFVVQTILGEHSGDVLNHFNASTAISFYVDSKHQLLPTIAERIPKLPSSHGASLEFDLLMRLSTAALLDQKSLNSPSKCVIDTVEHIMKNTAQGNLEKRGSLDVKFLYNTWKKNPFSILSDSPYFSLLFAQYVARLYKNCKFDIDARTREAIVNQSIGIASGIASKIYRIDIEELHKQPRVPLTNISLLLLGASSAFMLECNDLAKHLFEIALGVFQIYKNFLKHYEPKLINIPDAIDDFCHIGINLNILKESSFDIDTDLRNFIARHIEFHICKYPHAQGNIRVAALRLAGIRYVLKEDMALKIKREFDAAVVLDEFIQIREIIRNFAQDYNEFSDLLSKKGYSLTEVTPEMLHKLAQSIEYQDQTHIVKRPIDTLKEGKGDCKAVAALLAVICILAGKDVYLCYYCGTDIEQGQSNHIFIGWNKKTVFNPLEMTDIKELIIPIEQGASYGEFDERIIKDLKAIIAYPLDMLVKNDSVDDILVELTSKRTAILTNKQTK